MNAPMNPPPIAAVRSRLAAAPAQLFIDGAYVDAADGATLAVEDPATGETIAHASSAGPLDIDRAVRAARSAFEGGPWSRMSPNERSKLLWKLADAIDAAGDELATIETLDNGMPYGIARHAAVPMASESLRYYAGWPTKLGGETLPVSAEGEWHAYTLRQPVGVVGAISAWNFPLSMACGKLAPAMAAGCTVVLKPAEQTPLGVAQLGRLAQEVGIPDGVINVVAGLGSVAGQALVDHPLVNKISFTGSTATGKAILAASARDLKRVTLELGGKSPCVIFADADLERAIEGAAMGVFFNSGQICVARSRLFVHRKVFDRVVEGVAGFVRNLKVGNGFEPSSMLGPLVSRAQLDRVAGYVELGTAEGAELVAGGRRLGETGYFVEPTLLAGASPDMRVMREEIFGPVVCAVPFDDDDLQLIAARANDTEFGLAASIWTRDLGTAHRMARRIDAGQIEVNGGLPMQFALPFGGFKQSGIGRENGREGIEAFTELKTVTMRL